MVEKWQELVADKQKRRDAAIPQDWLVTPPPKDRLNVLDFPKETGKFSDFELEVTASPVEVLLPKLASGEWSSVDVTTAFYKRAIIAHQAVNCLTEIFVDKALERARYLDEQLKKTGKPVGPLHGLPISLKDQLAIKGLETTMGYVSWIGNYAEKDATLTEILYELGAVPFVRTNIPQTLMWPETFNNVFGRTSNPANRSLTCGGSSGGEGALIAMSGSPIGVGSDIGGSVRIPANFNGLYGHRPSYNRIPYRGAVNSLEGQEAIPSVLGPLCPTIGGVKAFMKAVIDAKPWKKDPLAVNQPWKQEGYDLVEYNGGKQLVFGILWHDGVMMPHPPIIRAMEITRDALVKAGHKVIDFKPYKHLEMLNCARGIWSAGSQEDYAAVTSITGEPLITTMSLKPDDPPTSKTRDFVIPSENKTAYGLWQIHKTRTRLRYEYLDHWNSTVEQTGTGRPVDAIISPVAPWTAPPHGRNWSADYTTIWNALDYPGLAFPVTTVDPKLDKVKPPHEFLSEDDKAAYAQYEGPEMYKDAPVGLQVVGRTGEDEAVIAIGEIIDKALKEFKQK